MIEEIEKQTCQVCLTNPIQITLSCLHEFCNECLHAILMNKINTQDLKSIDCPEQGCGVPLSWDAIQFNLSEEEFEKYCELKVKDNNVEDNSNDEILIDCLNPKCEAKWFIWKDADYTVCPLCSTKSCLKCRGLYHLGLTCEKAKLILNQSPDEIIFHTNIQDMGLKFCPHCDCATEKISGCNFMTCSSKICKGLKSFCYQCGLKLTEIDHISHYAGGSHSKIDRSACQVRNQQGQWTLDTNNMVQIVKVIDNTQACPQCKTLKPEICEILVNFNSQVCFCKCKEKFYCLSCSQELTEQNLEDHLDDDFNCKIKKT